jgi:hypothetical protein
VASPEAAVEVVTKPPTLPARGAIVVSNVLVPLSEGGSVVREVSVLVAASQRRSGGRTEVNVGRAPPAERPDRRDQANEPHPTHGKARSP